MKPGDTFTLAGVFVMARKPDRRFRCGYRAVVAQPPRLVEFKVTGRLEAPK